MGLGVGIMSYESYESQKLRDAREKVERLKLELAKAEAEAKLADIEKEISEKGYFE